MVYCPNEEELSMPFKNSESFQEGSAEINNESICWKLKCSSMDDKRTICDSSLMSRKKA